MKINNTDSYRSLALQYAVEFCGRTNTGSSRYSSNDVINIADRFLKYLQTDEQKAK